MAQVSGQDRSGILAEWSIPVLERTKYDQIFDGLQPVNGLLTGDKVKPVLLNSKLPVDVLGRVWELSDIDADGFLDREEFTVAMHLVYRALEKNPVPPALPIDMIPLSKRRNVPPLHGAVPVLPGLSSASMLPGAVPVLPGAVPVLPAALGLGPQAAPHGNFHSVGGPSSVVNPAMAKWVVNPVEKAKYDELFRQTDTDMDGLVNGLEIKDIFLQTGLPQPTLAHIWNLCDTKVAGKLNCDQFALAMHLVQQKLLNGIDPPMQLTPDMIPPSLQEGNLGGGLVNMDTPGMKELDKLSQEIEDLKREKLKLEQDKTQKEADIKISNGEVASLQKELDFINSTLTQLSAQKGEAQKRLDDLDDKRTKLEKSVKESKEKYEEEQKLIQEFQTQILNSESIVTNQEVELKRMRDELSMLRQEELELEQRVESSRKQSELLARRITDTQAEINQTRLRVEQIKSVREPLTDSIKQYDSLLKNEVSEDSAPSVDILSQEQLSIIASISAANSSTGGQSGFKYDPFNNKDPFINTAGSEDADPFHNEDPFANKTTDAAFSADPFGNSNKSDPFDADPFADSFSATAEVPDLSSHFQAASSASVKSEGNFVGGDPWGASFPPATNISLDKFDPFGFSASSAADDKFMDTGLDPFGTGSFAPAPTQSSASGRKHSSGKSSGKLSSPTASSIPVLPPKQKKAPAPPRPPAPRPASEDPLSYRGGDSTSPFVKKEKFSEIGIGKLTSEAEQLAWAKRDSQQEYERQKRLRDQEQADLERAIALSKQ